MIEDINHLNRTCATCGNPIIVSVGKKTKKIYNHYYFGKIDIGGYGLAYSLDVLDKFEELEKKEPRLKRWLRSHIPGYHYSWEEPTIKSFWKRLWIELFVVKSVEYWECDKCYGEDKDTEKSNNV